MQFKLGTLGGGGLADLVADEAADGDLVTELLSDLGDVLADGNLRVFLHEALIHKADRLEIFLDFAFNDLGDCLCRFAFDGVAGFSDLALLLKDARINLFARDRDGAGRGDLQSDVADQFAEGLVGGGGFLACAHFDEHADFRAGMDISRDQAVAIHFEARVAVDLDVLADLRDLFRAERFEIFVRIVREALGDFIAEGAEGLVLRDEKDPYSI